MRNATILTALIIAAASAPAIAQTAAEMTEIRARAVENCKANRGVDCASEDGLREWIAIERARPPGQIGRAHV